MKPYTASFLGLISLFSIGLVVLSVATQHPIKPLAALAAFALCIPLAWLDERRSRG